MLAYKKVNKSGGITLPQNIRHELGIHAGTALEVETVDDGILIKKHVPTCFNCGTVDDVVSCMGIEICRTCSEAIRKEFDSNDGNQ